MYLYKNKEQALICVKNGDGDANWAELAQFMS